MEDILRKIGSISRMLDSIANIEFRELNLNKGQFIYLVRIYENEGIIPERLAELIKVDRTTLSRAVAKLEANGLVTKQSDELNKKTKHLYTTEAGKDAARFIIRENNYSTKIATSSLSTEEHKSLMTTLATIEASIEKDWHHVKTGGHRNY